MAVPFQTNLNFSCPFSFLKIKTVCSLCLEYYNGVLMCRVRQQRPEVCAASGQQQPVSRQAATIAGESNVTERRVLKERGERCGEMVVVVIPVEGQLNTVTGHRYYLI